MAVTPSTYSAVGSVTIAGSTATPSPVTILTGASGGTAVRLLELINSGEYDAIVYIQRTTSADTVFFTLKVGMSPGQRILLWDGFHVINATDKLVMTADSDDIEAIATTWSGF